MAHFYEKTGSGVIPQHYVPLVSRPEELRPTRISDVRKMWKEGRVIVPSVTTILNVLAKPALINWKIDQHLEQAFKHIDLPRDIHYTESDYIFDIKRLTEQEMDKAPSAGSDFHKMMELFLTEKLPPEFNANSDIFRLCQNVLEVIEDKTDTTKEYWCSETSFVADGYGGQIDLLTRFNDSWTIDYKTKQTADKFKPGKMAYDEHSMQLAAYREGLGLPNARAANVFICLEDGQIDFHEHKEEELQKGWTMFQHALAIWKLQHESH